MPKYKFHIELDRLISDILLLGEAGTAKTSTAASSNAETGEWTSYRC